MLLNYNKDLPLYVIGSGVYTQELCAWIHNEPTGAVEMVNKDQFFNLEDNAQCLIGFLTFEYRKSFLDDVTQHKRSWPSYVHQSAVVPTPHLLGKGVIVQPLSMIGFGAILGDFCSVATMSSVGHNCHLGKNSVLSPGVIITGSTNVGDNVQFGQSTSVADRLTIGSDIEFLMNSVVTKNITVSGRYYGNKKVPQE